jgi:hypothetical protein
MERGPPQVFSHTPKTFSEMFVEKLEQLAVKGVGGEGDGVGTLELVG